MCIRDSSYAPDGTCGFQAFAHLEGLPSVSPSTTRAAIYDLSDPRERASLSAFYAARLSSLHLHPDSTSSHPPPIISKLEALILRWSSPSLPTLPFPHHLWADAAELHWLRPTRPWGILHRSSDQPITNTLAILSQPAPTTLHHSWDQLSSLPSISSWSILSLSLIHISEPTRPY